MKIKEYFNNSGYSLIFSIIALSVITGLTAYLMDSKKVNTVDSAIARSTSLVEVEKSRISTALSSNRACAFITEAPGNVQLGFRNKARQRLDIAKIVVVNGNAELDLVVKNQTYHNGILKVSNISTREITASDPGYYAGAIGSDNGWVIQINYTESSTGKSAYSGKKSSFAVIPMYMKGDPITECYSRGQNEKIDIAINDSCSPVTLAAGTRNRNSTLTTGATVVSDCSHNMTFDVNSSPLSGDANQIRGSTQCIDTNIDAFGDPTTIVGGQTKALIGFNLNTTTGELTFLTDKCLGIATTCIGATAMWKILGTVPSCAAPGINRLDLTCTAGKVLYKNGAGNYTCVSVNCPIADQFVASVNGAAGAVCYQARTSLCGANRYVKDFFANGDVDCGELPITTGSCGVNQFGQNITRNVGNYNGVMSCLTMTAKACVNPGRTNFVTNFNDSNNATCIIAPPAGSSCNVDGFNVPHLGSVTAYQSANGNPCVSEPRNCNNGFLSGSYTNGSCNNSCNGTTMAPLCTVPTSNHNTIAGNCSSGYGTCSYKCTNGMWLPQIANTCSSTPPSPCLAKTDANCSLPQIAAGSSTAGACVGGTSGSCNYSCSGAGAWAKVTNTCRLPFDCIASDIDGCSVPYRSNGSGGGAGCGIGLTGSCNYSCVDGVDTYVSNSCTASCTEGPQSVPAFTRFPFYNVPSVPYGSSCPAPSNRYCDITDNYPTTPTTYTPSLGPPYTHIYNSCVVNSPLDCAYQTTIGSCTSSNYTSSGSSTGSCNAGYTGSCSIDCFNGSYSAGANNCLQNCIGNTFAGCTVGANTSGNTTAGTCGAGYTGTCSYLCTNGGYSPVTTCTAAPPPCDWYYDQGRRIGGTCDTDSTDGPFASLAACNAARNIYRTTPPNPGGCKTNNIWTTPCSCY